LACSAEQVPVHAHAGTSALKLVLRERPLKSSALGAVCARLANARDAPERADDKPEKIREEHWDHDENSYKRFSDGWRVAPQVCFGALECTSVDFHGQTPFMADRFYDKPLSWQTAL